MLAFFFSLAFTNLYENIAYVILLQVLLLINHLPYRYIHRKLLFVIPMSLFVALGTLIYPMIPITFALKLGIRLYLMLALVFAINMTTPIIDLLAIFSGIVRRFFKAETSENMTMIFLLVINFIPLILGEMSKINQSLKSRRINLGNRSIKKNVFYLSTFVTAIVRRLDVLIDEFELVFYARNITVDNMQHIKKKYNYHAIDLIFTMIAIGLIVSTNLIL